MPPDPELERLVAASAIERVHILAWRDLDDPEAGGSEVHAATVASRWARAGLEVTMRTSAAPGVPAVTEREGYRAIRRGGRYTVFARAPTGELFGRHGPRDALVEIWNGMPFFSPLWARRPRVVWLHHVHAEMWDMTLPRGLAWLGRRLEERVAPPLYRRTPVCTLSESSKRELVEELGFHESLVTVVPPGIDARFTPGGREAEAPLVVAVGRLVPVKQFRLLIDALADARRRHPDLEAVIVGEGYERPDLEAQIDRLGARDWLRLPGYLEAGELVDLYRRAWVVASASAREGWGMTITEAAACGTPAVATRIAGHADAVVDGVSGILVDVGAGLAGALGRVVGDHELRARLRVGALDHARAFTWAATARETFRVLASSAS